MLLAEKVNGISKFWLFTSELTEGIDKEKNNKKIYEAKIKKESDEWHKQPHTMNEYVTRAAQGDERARAELKKRYQGLL